MLQFVVEKVLKINAVILLKNGNRVTVTVQYTQYGGLRFISLYS